MFSYVHRHHGCRVTEWRWRGYRMISLENDKLRVTFLANRGCEVHEIRHKASDIDVLAHTFRELPDFDAYIPSTAMEKDVWFDFYTGGWQTSFPMGFPPGFHAGVNHASHAEVSSLPWDCRVTGNTAETVAVEFFCRCRRLPFAITRTVELHLGQGYFSMTETVRNESPLELDYAWGHHPALGAPFLTPECRIDLPDGVIATRAATAEINSEWRFAPGQRAATQTVRGVNGEAIALTQPPPQNCGTMDNYEIELTGEGRVAVRNPELNLGFGLTWDRRVFPHLWVWEVSHGCPRQPLWGREYLLAFEPFNTRLATGVIPLAGTGKLARLAAGGTETVRMRAGFCASGAEFRGDFAAQPQA